MKPKRVVSRRAVLSSAAGAVAALSFGKARAANRQIGFALYEAYVAHPTLIFQQCEQWCWAASISMIFAAHGYDVPQQVIVDTVFGSLVCAPASNTAVIGRALSSTWMDTRGRAFSSRVTAAYDPLNGIYALNNSQIIQELTNNRPLLVCNTHHAMVQVEMQYYNFGFGIQGPFQVGVLDPWPTAGGYHYLPFIETVPMEQGGQLTFVATVSTTPLNSGPQLEAGWWWNPSESGRGYAMEVNARSGNMYFAAYMYDRSGNAVWYVALMRPVAINRYQGSLVTYSGGQTISGAFRPPTGSSTVGTVDVTLSSTSVATLSISAPGFSATNLSIQRFPIITNGRSQLATSAQPQTGWWWNPSESGRGFFLEVQGSTMFMSGYMYTNSGLPVWYVATNTMTSNAVFTAPLVQYSNGQFLGGTYVAPRVLNANVGNITLQFSSSTSGIMTLPNGQRVPIVRFTF